MHRIHAADAHGRDFQFDVIHRNNNSIIIIIIII